MQFFIFKVGLSSFGKLGGQRMSERKRVVHTSWESSGNSRGVRILAGNSDGGEMVWDLHN